MQKFTFSDLFLKLHFVIFLNLHLVMYEILSENAYIVKIKTSMHGSMKYCQKINEFIIQYS